MNRRNLVIVCTVIVLALVVAFLAFDARRPPSKAGLPVPNGFDDFTAAGDALVAWEGDPLISAEACRRIVRENAKALELVRVGLTKETAVPVTNDLNWLRGHQSNLSTFKEISRLLTAEGIVYLEQGNTNPAARCFTDCVVFAHAAHRHGVILDTYVAMAGQAVGLKWLAEVAPSISPDTRREILARLLEVDQKRGVAASVIARDHEFNRQAYGLWRWLYMKFVMAKRLRIMEASFQTKHASSVAALRLLTAEMAIRGYEATHGKLPATLGDLVPTWLPSVPMDPQGTGALVYRLTANSFELQSAAPGPNVRMR